MNRGKKSVCIDRTSEAGQQLIMELIKTADVVCESFVAGEMESGAWAMKGKGGEPRYHICVPYGIWKDGAFQQHGRQRHHGRGAVRTDADNGIS